MFGEMLEWLKGKKEKIVLLVGALLMVLPLLGFADWVPLLKQLQAAIQAGDWGAISTALIALIAALARLFARFAADRAHAERVERLDAIARK